MTHLGTLSYVPAKLYFYIYPDKKVTLMTHQSLVYPTNATEYFQQLQRQKEKLDEYLAELERAKKVYDEHLFQHGPPNAPEELKGSMRHQIVLMVAEMKKKGQI